MKNSTAVIIGLCFILVLIFYKEHMEKQITRKTFLNEDSAYYGLTLPQVMPKYKWQIPEDCQHNGELEEKSWGYVCLECFHALSGRPRIVKEGVTGNIGSDTTIRNR